MKKLNEVEIINKELEHEVKVDMLTDALLRQLQGFERLMESHVEWVGAPVAYNLVADLVNQLKYYAPAAFRDPKTMLDRDMYPKSGYDGPKYGSAK